jgi:anti-anti-sigma regulatory factor
VVFSFFRKGKGDDEPRTITPPQPVVPKAAAERASQAAAAAVTAAPAVPAPEEADWDDLLLASSATAESYSAVEEAAVLYANERVAEAIAALQNFLKENTASRDFQPWLLLFDLYQSQRMKAQFDELSMEFVVRFERSAPVWEEVVEVPRAPAASKARPARSGGMVVLKGTVDASAEEEIQRLLKLAEGEAPARLDVGQATGIDSSRAQLLAQVLLMVRKSGKRIAFSGAKEFTAVVKALTEGEGRQDQAFWRLLFELYEFQNQESQFEDAAVDYAVTFELSPPSWEPMPGATEAAAEAVAPAEEAAEAPAPAEVDVFSLEGVLNPATEHRLKELERYAEGRTEVRVDMARATRVDFMSVGTVISTLIALNQAGKKVTISGQNEMIHALFEVMGVRDFATLARRKAR